MRKPIRKFFQGRVWLGLLALVIIWKLLLLGVMLVTTAKIHHSGPSHPYPGQSSGTLVTSFTTWDAGYYLDIARNGYGKLKSAKPAYYPLFPLLIRGLSKITSLNLLVSAAIINTIAVYWAIFFLFWLACDFCKSKQLAWRVVFLFLFFPSAFFLTAIYTEALFCALAFGAFYFARKRHWLVASLFLAPLTALRLPGLLVAAAVFVEYLSSHQFKLRRLKTDLGWFFLAPVGFLLYVAFLKLAFNDSLMFKHAYNYNVGWQYQVFNLNIASTVVHEILGIGKALLTGTSAWNDHFFDRIIAFGAWVGALVLGLVGIKKLPASYTFLVFASLVLFALNSNFTSVNRYILPLFPIYLVLIDCFKQRLTAYSLLLATSATVMGVMATLFFNGHWAG